MSAQQMEPAEADAVGIEGETVSLRHHAGWDEPCCDEEWQGWHCTLPVDHEPTHEAGAGVAPGGGQIVAAVWS